MVGFYFILHYSGVNALRQGVPTSVAWPMLIRRRLRCHLPGKGMWRIEARLGRGFSGTVQGPSLGGRDV
jgi:hypothetical protein